MNQCLNDISGTDSCVLLILFLVQYTYTVAIILALFELQRHCSMMQCSCQYLRLPHCDLHAGIGTEKFIDLGLLVEIV